MFEAYTVAVKLSLINNVNAGLSSIASQLGVVNRGVIGTQNHFDTLHAKIQKIQKIGLIGGGVAATGFGMLSMLKGPIEAATSWERVMASMKQKGLGDAQIADAQKYLRANDIYGVSLLERAKIFNEAQGSFRESGMSGSSALDAAKTMTPALAGYKLAMATLDDKHKSAAEGSFTNLNKIVELMGGLGNTKLASEIVGGVFKAAQSSGKMVTERDLKQFIVMGGSAVSGLSSRTIFGALEPQIGEFGGSAMGTGLNTAYRLLTGTQSKPSRLFVREALKLGLWQKDNLVFNSQGGIKEYKGHPLKEEMAALMKTDVPGFARQLLSIYASNGITSQADRERENDILLGRTGAKIYNKIMMQLPVIEQSLLAYDKAQSPDQMNASQKNSIMQKSIELHKQWNDALLNFGLVAIPLANKAIDGMTYALKGFTEFAKSNPVTLRILTTAFIGLGAALAFGGAVTLLSSAFAGLGLVLGVGGGAAGIGLLSILTGPVGIIAGLTALGVALVHVSGVLKIPRQADGEAHTGEHWVKGFGRGGAGGHWAENTGGGSGDWGDRDHVGQHYQRAGRGGSWINNTIVLPDGRVLANVVTQEQSKQAAKPQTGINRVDPSMMQLRAGASGNW